MQELQDGAKELSDGMKEFQEDGIKKIVDLYQDNIPTLIDRLKALRDLGQDYGSFSGLPKDADGKVKFLIRTDGITAKDDDSTKN